ncbi:MAG: flippase [Deltaproteobacteria bacterium]|nr:flippase [Deltaproteobacteria bacterium]
MTTPSSGAADQAAEVARGSGVVFAGNLLNRALRLITNWFLSGALGTAGYGLYELARTVVTILASLAPLGADKGMVLFGARYRASGERERLKGALLASLGIAALGGPALTAGLLLATGWVQDPALARALRLSAPAVAIWSVLLVGVGALRGAKDMRGQTISYLVVLPVGMLATAAAAVALGWDLEGVLIGFVLANLLSLLATAPRMWRAYRGVLTDRSLKPRWELGPLLAFSLPEGLSSMLFRVNQWTDTLMVGALATMDEVGLYRVAVSLAMLGELPSVAVNTMFQPVVAELVYAGDEQRLREVVRIVTRWMLILAGPVYIGIYVGQDLALAFYDTAYGDSADALSVLVWGQAVYVACVPVVALIPMSGRARLNLINATAAALLNVGLNGVLIPTYGVTGAAMATGATLALWSLWRVAQVWWLMGTQAFSPRALALVVATLVLAFGGRALSADQPLAVQLLATALAVLAFMVFAWSAGREPEDEALLAPARRRIAKKFGRTS